VEAFSSIEAPPPEIQPTWPLPPPAVELAGTDVHVWSARLLDSDFDDAAGMAVLCESERLRGGKFRFTRDRKNFVARRGLLRAVLGHYLKVEPSRVCLAYEERGKPRLSAPEHPSPLHFNFTHSGRLALLAVSRFSPLGVDVERIRPMPEMVEMAGMFFSAPENALLHAAPPEQKLNVFFTIWTRKEAWLKATGEGIAGALADLDSSRPAPPSTIQTLFPAPGFAAAVAVTAGPAAPRCWQWRG
jgi:4'-phosphopantetheinyl transferase